MLKDKKNLIWIILLYGLVVTVVNIDFTAVFVDEAFHINMGHQFLSGDPCPGCPFATGSVLIHPVIVSIADSMGGLRGARGLNILLGLALVFCIYVTGARMFNVKTGLIAASLFLFSGQTAYLMKLATYDMTAAFLLGCGFMLVVLSMESGRGTSSCLILLSGSIVLFLAAVTKYLIPVFIPPILIYVWYRKGFARTLLWAAIPMLVLAALFYFFAPFAPRAEVIGQIRDVQTGSHVSFIRMADWTFRWISLAWLLSVFGFFHEKHGKTAIVLFILSLPIILVHLVTRAEQSVNKNVIYSLIFLAPSAALGVDRIGSMFSMRSTSKALRHFFTVAVIIVFWTYGIYNLRWLERQYPDVRPMIDFFDREGFNGMKVVMNGWDSDIYIYSLGSKYPDAEYIHITEAFRTDDSGSMTAIDVDFVVCEDNYYGKMNPCSDYHDFIKDDYRQLEHFLFELSWGRTDTRIFGRR
ncbi:MAG: hypothetical protein JW814_07110 [Candidatus Krumholzibacteriota bacterium]|nr:hypothetical protein [Candidatus Krumholzibacteriota bacterium]